MHGILEKIAQDEKLRRQKGRWSGPCPECGGKKTSDRFSLRDNGGFRCFACGFKGDIITWLRTREGMSCPEAHIAVGKECQAAACPVRSTCRLGDGSGLKTRSRRVSIPNKQVARGVAEAKISTPGDSWQQWADRLIKSSVQKINAHQNVCLWLAKRGIPAEARCLYNLGYNPVAHSVPRATIGLPPRESDGKKTLWVPDGLIIPITSGEKPHRIRIRRPKASRQKLLENLKYVWIEGSGTSPMILGPAISKSRGVVIVEAELDAIAIAYTNHDVTVIALGTVSAGVPDDLRADLENTAVILLAFDADPAKDGKSGPGAAAASLWKQTFRRAVYWPVPEGKDPGEYAGDFKGDLRAWIGAGLPPVKQQDEPDIFLNECLPGGGAEIKEDNCPDDLEILKQLMQRHRIILRKNIEDGGVKIEGLRGCPAKTVGEITNLVWFSELVGGRIDNYQGEIITAKNILKEGTGNDNLPSL